MWKLQDAVSHVYSLWTCHVSTDLRFHYPIEKQVVVNLPHDQCLVKIQSECTRRPDPVHFASIGLSRLTISLKIFRSHEDNSAGTNNVLLEMLFAHYRCCLSTRCANNICPSRWGKQHFGKNDVCPCCNLHRGFPLVYQPSPRRGHVAKHPPPPILVVPVA